MSTSTSQTLAAELIALAVAGDVQAVLDRTTGLAASERKALWKDAKRSTEALHLLCGVRIVVETHHGDGRVTQSGAGAGVTNRKVKWLRKQYAADAASLPALAKVASINDEREAPSIYRAAMALGGALASQSEVRRLLAAESPFRFWRPELLPEVRYDLVRAVANRPEGWRIAQLDRFFADGWHDHGIVGELHDGHPAFAEHSARWWGLGVAYKWGKRDDIDPLNDASLLYALTVPRKESWQPLSDTFVTRPGVHAACRERCADPGFRRKLVRLALEQLGAPHKPLIAKSWLTLLQGAEASTAEQGADPDAWAALATAKETTVAAFGIATLVRLVEAGHVAPSAGLARLGEATWHPTGKIALAAWKVAAKLAGKDADLTAQLVGIAGEAQGSKHRKLADAAKKLLDAQGVPAEAEGPAAASVDLSSLGSKRAADSPWLASLRASLGEPWPVRVPVQEPPFLGADWQPLESAQAAAEVMAGALQGDGLDPRWDQILDGVVRHPETDGTVRKTLSPIFAAARKQRRESHFPAIGGHRGALERLAAAWLGDELPPISNMDHAEPNHRVEGAIAALTAGDTRTPLSTPTTVHGWLDPVVFAQRLAAGEPRHPVELSIALRRLPVWPSRRAEALALLPADGGPALAAAYEALAVGADSVAVADAWLVATIPERKMWFMGWWNHARGTWERESARSTALSWDFGNPTDQAAAGRTVHGYAPAMVEELAAIGAKRLSAAVVQAEHIGKNTGAMALILMGLHPTVDVAALLPDLAAGFPSKFPAHRVAILDLLEGALRDGRLAPRAVAAAFAEPLRTAAKNVKGVHEAMSDWAATGDLATAVTLLTYEAALAAGDIDGLKRNAGPLLNGLDALLGASGRALDGAEARAVIAELAGRKKANAAVKAARAIHARSATQPSLDLLAASEILA